MHADPLATDADVVLLPPLLPWVGREEPGADHISVDQAGLARRVSKVGQGELQRP